MATKAERAKVEQQRAANAGHPKKQAYESAAKRAAARGRGRTGAANSTSHKEAPRVGGRSPYEPEVSATKRPSRKSSRRSPAHLKPDAPLRIAAMNRLASPKQRASR